MSLSEKSDQEIIQLLNEYGIKHGPIVDSTRGLYERKLRDAMVGGTKPSSDKTYYREEEEEVTYIHYRTPETNEGYYGDHVSRRNVGNKEAHDVDDENDDYDTEPQVTATAAAYHSAAPSKEPIQEAAGGVSLWPRLLLLAVVAGFLYVVYCSMEADTTNPFGEKQLL